MSSITTAVLWGTIVIAAHGVTLLASWLRMRWQAQQELARHHALVAMVQALPEGGQIREDRSDGTWTHLAVTRAGGGEGCHG